MTTPQQPPIRLTAWPPEPLPLPQLWVYPLAPVTTDGFLERDLSRVRPKGGQRGTAVTVPDELYLRELREIDLDDARQVAAFVAQYGPLGLPDWSELPGAYLPGQPQVLSLIDQVFAGYLAERGLSQRPQGLTHVEVFGVHARLLRDLVRILEAHQGLLTLDEVEAQWESRWVTPEQWRSAGMREALAFMAECLHEPLRDFHARLEIREEPWPQHVLAAVPSLYAVLCLQLWNHIAEETPYRVCQRSDCGRLFVRQQGRAKYEQHKRSGSLYCTVQCARVVASRRFREEKRRTSG
jgi:hypothetical protein